MSTRTCANSSSCCSSNASNQSIERERKTNSSFSFNYLMEYPQKFLSQVLSHVIIFLFNKFSIRPMLNLLVWIIQCQFSIIIQRWHHHYLNRFKVTENTFLSLHTTLSSPSLAGVICAAPTQAGWFRALITVYNSNDDMAMIKFLDYGGYLYVHASSLRVLR